MRSSVSSKFQKLTNYARACNGQVIDEVLWHRGARVDAGEGGEKKEKRLQRKTAIVPLPSATREKGRRPILSRRKNGTGYDEHRCRGFSTDSPVYKIFLFKKYISQYSGIRFISLFLVRLKNNIYLFSKYFRKIFNIFETSISIDLWWNVKSEKKTISVERKYLKSRYLEGKSNLEKIRFSFFLLSKKRSRFKSIFIVKSSGKIIVHARSHAKKLPLLLLFRSSRKKENKKKRKNIRDPNASISSFYSPVSRSDRVISCSGWQFRVRRG